MALTSAAGLVSLLDDKGSDVKAFALKRLYDMVDEFWAEISEAVMKIEILHEDSNFEYNKLAALLVSKVYYHLAVYDDALHYALCAEDLFDLNANTEFVETIIAKCIDKYTALRTAQDQLVDSSGPVVTENSDDSTWSVTSPTYKRLEHVVNKMFDRCFDHKQYKQALGIAIETRRLDIFEKAIISSDDQEGMLRYAFRVVLTLIDSVRLRNRLLKILVSVYMNRALPSDAVNVCQCLVLMDDPQATADTLEHLLLQSQEAAVTAYQIGFDLYENATQNFLQRVSASLARSSKLSHIMSFIERDKNAAKSPKTPEGSVCTTVETTDGDKNKSDKKEAEEAVETASSGETSKETEIPADETLSEFDKEIKSRLMHLVSILSGDKVIELHLQFLIRNNKADLRLLERIRDEVRHSVTHNATVIANGIMHCGTTSDQFLRDHLNWLGKAVNWAKFTATATLGVIHKGHEKEALRLMSAYLPKDASGSSGSVYTEGGGLFALGLIHANHGGTMTEYLLNQCKEATAEPVRHGACLGLGLAAMGTGREDVYDQIKLNLYQDDAITGEAAGIGIGLVMLGTGSTRAIEDLLGYAKETAHEKIIRGVALGIALVMYGRVEEADELIDNLIIDNDPILRWSGMATIAMAYCGTGNNQAVKRLLHAAVSDTNDDVRRWAVTALGFVLFKNPEQVPSLVSLLVESYHPHLRYGAAMAVGIACAGTALKEAVTLLETLHEGTVPFVRQGALIANAMVLIQQNAVTSPKEPNFSLLNNPARVMRSQQRYVTLPESSRYVTLKPISQGGILMVQDKSPQDAEVLVENVLGHGPTLERSGVGGGTGSASGTSSSDLAAALGSGSNSKTELIHASTIGAYLDEDDDDDDEEDEDDDEDSSSDMHEEDEDDDEEEFDVAAATVSTVEIEESDDHTSKGDIEMSESSTDVKRDKSRGSTSGRRGSRSHVSGSEPNPPEPFLYIEEGTTSQTTTVTTTSSNVGSSSTSIKSDSTVATDTSSCTNAKQSPPTSSSEPMDVTMETDKEAEKKSDSELDSKSKENNDK
ncbi:unnamed protein product [Schistosoma rodhaini]|uniref:26S proteasome non-ATPase regulatory subunit 1 n=1 Tax=Schistosoma rodhaini TaxID=6188 RepID=A0AA85F9J7_9TREM|nr:unnamed protein product [Schistosoma rodhaini]